MWDGKFLTISGGKLCAMFPPKSANTSANLDIARARSFPMAALGLPSRNMNLALTKEIEQDSRFSLDVAYGAM
jgi:hypothetical protein